MIALEVREAAAILLWRTKHAEKRMLGEAEMYVADDVATHYRVMPGSWSGSDSESSGETLIVPSPPESASSLTVDVASFNAQHAWPVTNPPRTDEAQEPWRFVVPLK